MASRYLISRSVLLNGRLSQPLGSVAHTQRCLQPALPSTVHLQSYSGISSELLPIQIQHSGNQNKLTCLTVFPRSHTNRFFHESSVKCTEEKTKFSQIPKSPIEADYLNFAIFTVLVPIIGGGLAIKYLVSGKKAKKNIIEEQPMNHAPVLIEETEPENDNEETDEVADESIVFQTKCSNCSIQKESQKPQRSSPKSPALNTWNEAREEREKALAAHLEGIRK